MAQWTPWRANVSLLLLPTLVNGNSWRHKFDFRTERSIMEEFAPVSTKAGMLKRGLSKVALTETSIKFKCCVIGIELKVLKGLPSGLLHSSNL